MSEIVTTFTGFEVKSGTNDNGSWSLHKFKDSDGKVYQTFDDGLAEQGRDAIGQPIRVEFEVETRNSGGKTRTNNKILSLSDPSVASAAGGGVVGGVASEAELKLQSLGIAIQMAQAGMIGGETFAELADGAENVFAWATGTLELDDEDIEPPSSEVSD